MKLDRIEPLLKQRKAVEERQQQELAEVQTRLMDTIHRQAELRDRIERVQIELLRKEGEGMDAAEIVSYQRYLKGLREQLQSQAEAVRKIRESAAAKREALLAAHRDREALEILREETIKSEKLIRNRTERRELDELVVQNFLRAQGALEEG